MKKNTLFTNKLDVLRNVDLISDKDVNFLIEHRENFEKRFRTRSLFRSKFEMEAAVLRDDEHPTPDSKYWQAIGEEIVQLQELITLSYESGKLEADGDLLAVEIEQMEAKLEDLDGVADESSKGFEKRRLAIRTKKKKIEYEQIQFNLTMQRKVAKERMREIVTWEGIIAGIEPNLKHGSEDFELHHPERYLQRYQSRMNHLEILSGEEKENVMSHFQSFKDHPDNGPDRKRILPASGVQQLSQPKDSSRKEYRNEDEMLASEPVVKQFFKRETNKILVGTPHRIKEDQNASNLSLVQAPAGMSMLLEEPFGFAVADARNFCVNKAIEWGFEYLFFVDDDVIIPKNALVTLMEHLHNGYDVASGFYYRKYKPLESAPMVEDKKGRPGRVEFEIGDLIENPLVFCSGCTLYKVDAFRRIENPWYKDIFMDGRVQVTEDTYFCQQLRNLKDPPVKTVLDTNVQCLHVDKAKGILYGHPDIVEDNVVLEKYRDGFAL